MEAPTTWQQVHRPPHGTQVVTESGYEVPPAYGRDQLTLLVRDPECVFSFWEVTNGGWQAAVERLNREESAARAAATDLVLRVYDITGSHREQSDDHWHPAHARGYTDFHVAGTSSWYIHTDAPGLTLAAEIGAKRGVHFVPIARSHMVATPPGRVSDELDEDWMTVQELYRFVSQMPVGTSSPAVHAALSRRRQLELSSGFAVAMAHPGFSPGFSPGYHTRVAPPERATFRTVPRDDGTSHQIHVDVDVVLSGRVNDPSATVIVAGQQVALDEHGQFRHRLPLPDGTHVWPVEVHFSDDSRRAVTPVITRETF